MKMTYSEAKEFLSKIDPVKLVIDYDGRFRTAMRVAGRFEEAFRIVNGESVQSPVFLSEKEASLLKKAFYEHPSASRPIGKPTRAEAEKIIAAHTTPSGKVILDDIEGHAAGQVIERAYDVMRVMDGKGNGNYGYLTEKEVKILKKIAAATGKPIKRENKKEVDSAEKKSFWQRLFRRPEKPKPPVFDWTNSLNWQNVQFRSGDVVLFSHRLNVAHLTPDVREEVRAGLANWNIKIEERHSSIDDGDTRKGDLTFRVADKISIERLRHLVFNWAIQPGGRPVEMTVAEYIAKEEKKRSLSNAFIQKSQSQEKSAASHSFKEGLHYRGNEGSR